MGLRIRTNIASINAQRRLAISTDDLQSSSSKLASGERINRAADDAAGLAISENLRASIRSLSQAKRNGNDAISLVQTAEGGLSETTNMLIRLRELAIQAASDTIGPSDRSNINQEFVKLKDEIDRIAAATEFNGTRLLVGAVEVGEDMMKNANAFPYEIQIGKDYYEGSDGLDKVAPVNIIRIDLQNLNAFTDGEGSLGIGRSEEGTNVSTKQGAQGSISVLDSAMDKVSEYRSYLGALQNRLGSAVTNLATTVENVEAARSRIRDTDYAAETAKMTQANIMQQAGAAVLGQANMQPSIALKLLQF